MAAGTGEGIETVEYFILGVIRDAGALVTDYHCDMICFGKSVDRNPASDRREVDGVFDDIEQRLFDQETLAQNAGCNRLSDDQNNVFFQQRGSQGSCDLVDQVFKRDVFFIDEALPVFDRGQFQQALNQFLFQWLLFK